MRVGNITIPDKLSGAIEYVHRRAVELGAKAQARVDSPEKPELTDGENTVARAADLVGKLKLNATLAAAAGYVSWKEIAKQKTPPDDPAGLTVWCLAQCVIIVSRIEAGEDIDLAAVSAALRFYAASVKAEPDSVAITAARELRGDKRLDKKEPGAKLSKITPAKRRPESKRL